MHVRCQFARFSNLTLHDASAVVVVVAFSSLARIPKSVLPLIPCLCFFFFFFFFWNGGQKTYTNSTLHARISPQWLTKLKRLWPNVYWQVACELVSGKVHTICLDSGTVSPLRLDWVKGVCVFRCNLPSALLEEWPGSFTATTVTQGWKEHWIRVSTQS